MEPSQLLVTVSGPDVPGALAALTGVLAAHGAPLRSLDQVAVHGQSTCFLRLDDDAPIDALRAAAEGLGLSLRVDAPTAADGRCYVVTAIADPIEARHVQVLAGALAEHGAHVGAITPLTAPGLSALELRIDADPARFDALRHALLELAMAEGVDLALQPDGLARRSRRLVVMDMDSTLIQMEVIDELARIHGVSDKVKRLTAEAMAGNLDYAESLRRRVAMLEGLAFEKVLEVADRLPYTAGAEQLVRALQRMGWKTAVLSGGFDVAASRVKEHLGLDHAHSNRLEVVDGLLTGRVLEPIVTPERKVQLLQDIAEQEGIPLEDTVAIGDGANDLLMIERAGLGIAFHPKPKLRKAADTSLSAGGLDQVLYLLGIPARHAP